MSRLTSAATKFFADFDSVFAQRPGEADEFYAELQRDMTDPDARLVQRQAFAGMIWSKQFFYYDELNLPDGRMVPLKVRSMVGLIPRNDSG